MPAFPPFLKKGAEGDFVLPKMSDSVDAHRVPLGPSVKTKIRIAQLRFYIGVLRDDTKTVSHRHRFV
jgi:hypothetical protein